MVYISQCSHVYQYPFKNYLKLELKKNFEVDESYETSFEITEKTLEDNGVQRLLKKTVWKNIIPEQLRQDDTLKFNEIEFQEEFWVDEENGMYWKRCRNVVMNESFDIWMTTTGYKDSGNAEWTKCEYECGVESFTNNKLGTILENVIGTFINNLIKKTITDRNNILIEQCKK